MKPLLCIFSTITLLLFTFGAAAYSRNVPDSTGINKININFADEDAYFIYNSLKLEIVNENSTRTLSNYLTFSLANKIVLHYAYRMKLNTRNGVENFGQIAINKKQKAVLKSFEVKAYKPGGEIIQFDSTQIFHSSIPVFDSKLENMDITKYVIPGVEAGDEIEVSYSFETEDSFSEMLHDNVFLNNFVPSLHSEYTIVIPYPYQVYYKTYNGFKNPKIETEDLKVTNTFELDSIPAVKDLTYTCLYDKFPFFYYSVEYGRDESSFLAWKDYYNEIVSLLYPQLIYNQTEGLKFDKWIKRNLKDVSKETKYQEFESLYTLIKNNFEIILPSEKQDVNEENKNLFNNKISRPDLYRLYANALDYLHIDYYICFGRSKYEGAIDEGFLRKQEFTDIFLMYYNSNHTPVFIFPHFENTKYNLNEIPSHLNGTVLFIARNDTSVKNKDNNTLTRVDSDSLLLLSKLKVNRDDFNSNYVHKLRNIGVNLSEEKTKYNSVIDFSGFSSVDNRSFYMDLLHNKDHYKLFLDAIQKGIDVFKLDSIFFVSEKPNYPFKYSVGLKGELGKFYTYLNDSTIVISVEDILNNNKMEYDKKNRNLDLVLPYAYSDIQDLVITFDKPIYVVNKEQLSSEMSNEEGSFKFESFILGDKVLKLTSTYVVKKTVIDKKAFPKLNDINDAANEMSNSRIIIGISK